MKLKAVELNGFKSFPEKTKIEFPAGLTAIVGPNGSGKSNISDAVRWVLGEMSVKSLRGSRMEDIIFNGAQNLAPASSAAVSLVLDTKEEHEAAENTDDKKGYSIGDFPETIITRKYYRTGESEYYINKKQVRLKDIYELFYDTGIGREGYSVIGQGKISEVLSKKDEDRRSIFEEAAGISKYRYKKTESERKLAETENNLVRLKDIADEIGSRIGPLEKESENAKAYLKLSEEKKSLEITLWLDRIDKSKKNAEILEREKNELEALNSELSVKSEELEKLLDESIQKSYEHQRKIAEAERMLSQTKQEEAAVLSEEALLNNDSEHLKKLKGESGASLNLTENRINTLKAEYEKENSEYELSKKNYELKLNDYTELDERYSNEKNVLLDSLGSYNRLSEELREEEKKLSELKLLKMQLDTQEKNSSGLAEEAQKELDEYILKYEQLEKNKVEAEKKTEAIKGEISEKQSEAAELKDKLELKKEAQNSIKAQLAKKKVKLAAVSQRLESLERLERLFEGYPGSVKAVLNAAKEYKLKAVLYGSVSSVINTKSEYVVALECALGAAVQFIIVGSENDAKAAIEYLKQTKAGRATFLPLTTVKGKTADVSKLRGLRGFVGLASELAEADEKFRGIVDDLLGRTIIADNMDNAVKIAHESGFKIKIVTLDGQIIHAGGHFTGGSEGKRTGMLSRSVDMERLSEEIKKQNEELLECEAALNREERKTNEITEKLTECEAEYSELTKSYAALENECKILNQRAEEEKKIKEKLEAKLEELRNGGKQKDSEIKEAGEKIAASEELLKRLGEKLEEAGKENKKRDELERGMLDEINRKRLELSEAKNNMLRLEEKVERTKSEMEELLKALENSKLSFAEADKKIVECSERLKELESIKKEIAEKAASFEEAGKRLAELSDEKQEKINKLRTAGKENAEAKEEAYGRLVKVSAKLDGAVSDYESILAKLWDEYEFSYSQAKKFRLPEEKMEKAPSRLASLKSQIRSLGTVNVNAVEEYAAAKERYDFLSTQLNDLYKSKQSLTGAIKKLEETMEATFMECFEKINIGFGEVFSELFGGGSARVTLLEPEKPLESGIEIVVRPPGKTVKSITLLSGGEQSFAAIALYLALQNINPAPFCIFDEIESALDEVNVAKLASFVKRRCDRTQYIFITHRRGTMERADTLYGITMPRRGISEHLRLDLSDAKDREKASAAIKA